MKFRTRILAAGGYYYEVISTIFDHSTDLFHELESEVAV